MGAEPQRYAFSRSMTGSDIDLRALAHRHTMSSECRQRYSSRCQRTVEAVLDLSVTLPAIECPARSKIDPTSLAHQHTMSSIYRQRYSSGCHRAVQALIACEPLCVLNISTILSAVVSADQNGPEALVHIYTFTHSADNKTLRIASEPCRHGLSVSTFRC